VKITRDSRIEVIKGDITKQKVDAIVNAANNSLLGGGGVDGAIHKAGGEAILEECIQIRNRQGGCPTGEAVITTGGNLPARYVIHTVGPIWQGGTKGEPEKLRNAYRNSLKLCVENNIQSVAFPNISTGVYGYPKELAAQIAIEEICCFLEANKTIKKIIFVCFDSENYVLYQKILG
jgi:O-acetyl-ADP-ribose deacetylase (regulator of RNase III)